MKRKSKKNKKKYSKDKIPQNDQDNEYENESINLSHKIEPHKKQHINLFKKICSLHLIFIFLIISFIFLLIIYIIIYIKTNKSIESIKTKYQSKIIKLNFVNNSNLIESGNKTILMYENNNKQINLDNPKENEVINNTNIKKDKIGVAWVYKSVFGNGIGRMLSLACSELAKLVNNDIYLIALMKE